MNTELKQREIEFRVWDIEKKCFIPNEVFGVITSYLGAFGVMIKDWEDYKEGEYLYDKFQILSQYTGVDDADINGNEVFDGDIIENCDTKGLEIVYWNEDKAAWYCRYVGDEKRIVSLADSLGNMNKKVGNIFENPELINQTT
jgi:hypothetical protein